MPGGGDGEDRACEGGPGMAKEEGGEMKPHYFEQDEADKDDLQLMMAKHQGYVPQTCLLCGIVVMDEIKHAHDPCRGCHGPREKCKGRLKE